MTTSAPADMAAALNATADLLEEVGWVQRQSHGPNGERCALSALGTACGLGFDDLRAAGFLYTDTRLQLQDRLGTRVTAWNDAPGRTKDEVVSTLRETATSLV